MSGEPPNYAGPTVNERLLVAGLLQQVRRSIKSGDRQRAVDLLRQVEMRETEARFTTDAVLANPRRHEYPGSG